MVSVQVHQQERSGDEAVVAAYLAALVGEVPGLLGPAVDREELAAQARAVLATASARLELTGPPGPAAGRVDITSDEIGRRRARAGVHPGESLRAAHVLFAAALPELVRRAAGRRTSQEVAVALHAALSERLVAAAASFVDVALDHVSANHLDERRRTSRELHDRTSHGLGAAIAGLDLALHHLEHGRRPDLERLRATRALLLDTLEEVRALSSRLRDVVGDRTLGEAVREHLDAVAPAHLRTAVVDEVGLAVPAHVREELYLVVREALRNALVHGRGATRVEVDLDGDRTVVRARVHDDGAGFDAAAAARRTTVGLRSMRERSEGLGGTFDVRSAPGAGCTVLVRVPLLVGFTASAAPGGEA